MDRQWLAAPGDGVRFKLEVSGRRYRVPFLKVTGFGGEELFDTFLAYAAGESVIGSIGGLEVIFEKGRAVTTLYVMS